MFDKVQELRSRLDTIQPKNREFAKSLCDYFDKHGNLSEKQLVWVDKLLQVTKTITIDAIKIEQMFTTAKEKLKAPRLTITSKWGKVVIKHTPDGIWVLNNKQVAGKIEGGIFYSRGLEHVEKFVMEINSDPEHYVGYYGRLQQCCCFCQRGLSDQRSLEVGYGPVCAQRFQLKWGTKTNEHMDFA